MAMTIAESVQQAFQAQTAEGDNSNGDQNTGGSGKASTDNKGAESTSSTTKESATTSGESTSASGNTDDSTESVVETDLTADEIKEAEILYKSLKNPNQAGLVIKNLATQAGLLAAEEGGSKKTQAQATQAALDILKAELGPENEDLALKFAPALEKIIEQTVKKALKPVEERVVQSEAERAAEFVNNTVSSFIDQYEDAKDPKIQTKMVELMGQVQPSGKISMFEYVGMIYKLAGGSKEVAKQTSTVAKTAKTIEKITKNAKEARIPASSDVEDTRVKTGSHRPSAREAVEAAFQAQIK